MPVNPDNAISVPGVTLKFEDVTCPDESCCGETTSFATLPASMLSLMPLLVGVMLSWRGIEIRCESAIGPTLALIPWATLEEINSRHHYNEVSPALVNLGEAI